MGSDVASDRFSALEPSAKTGVVHRLKTHGCLRVPGPPNLGLSAQLTHVPQSSLAQLAHWPHGLLCGAFPPAFWSAYASDEGQPAGGPPGLAGDCFLAGGGWKVPPAYKGGRFASTIDRGRYFVPGEFHREGSAIWHVQEPRLTRPSTALPRKA